jgi:hypothetical protein
VALEPFGCTLLELVMIDGAALERVEVEYTGPWQGIAQGPRFERVSGGRNERP